MKEEIKAADEKFENLKRLKQEGEKELQDLLKTRDANHLKAVEELEALYEKKLALENDQYIEIEQILEDYRQKFKEEIKLNDDKHADTIDKLQKSFRQQFNRAQGKYDRT